MGIPLKKCRCVGYNDTITKILKRMTTRLKCGRGRWYSVYHNDASDIISHSFRNWHKKFRCGPGHQRESHDFATLGGLGDRVYRHLPQITINFLVLALPSEGNEKYCVLVALPSAKIIRLVSRLPFYVASQRGLLLRRDRLTGAKALFGMQHKKE